jgi:tRNA A37 threonylcarbamoyladenosine synthetase subunit TsaC/SUA5/YrdC
MSQVILAQTDTTVGFLSKDTAALAQAKQRPITQPFITVYANFQVLNSMHKRIPKAFRKAVRRSKATTYVVKADAFRVIGHGSHHRLLQQFGWLYSTSANLTGQKFDREYCEAQATLVVEAAEGFHAESPSALKRIGRKKARRLR